MCWTRSLLHDFWTARALNEIDEQLAATRRARAHSDHTTRARIDALEDDDARLTLLLRSLTDVAIESGAVSREDLGRVLERTGVLDGVPDGKLAREALHDAMDGEPVTDRPPAPRPGRRRGTRD